MLDISKDFIYYQPLILFNLKEYSAIININTMRHKT